MVEQKKIASIEVTGLQEMFDYKVDFAGDGTTAILIAPNGFGKTAFLAVLNACLQFKLVDAASYKFDKLTVVFDDKTRWLFAKTEYTDADLKSHLYHRNARVQMRHRRRFRHYIRFSYFDARGKAKKDNYAEGIDSIPPEILARALDRNLPVQRIAPNKWRDLRLGEVMRTEEVLERYRDVLLTDFEFRDQLGDFAPGFFDGVDVRLNCVFIETQRLLQAKKPNRPEAEAAMEPQEEILRQADHLAKLLQRTYASYAATSQDLDRSFPNRLIARSEGQGKSDIAGLKADLNAIEERRKSLTDAGILVETSELVIAPKDEFLPNVADALQIYVEDSKKKLATFDEVYNKVSVFRELLSKKLRPKELVINREVGAQVRGGKNEIGLSQLSSGEKHEFIMLFKLIFETPANSLVLIDEPEISLHVSWQLEFMSDLAKMQSANQFQSIIATHSPQIIQGADHITFDLADQVK